MTTPPKKLVLTGAMMMAAFPVVAAQEPPRAMNSADAPGTMTPESQVAADAALGFDLAEYARRNRDAAAMIEAARILRSLPPPIQSGEGRLVPLEAEATPVQESAQETGPTWASLLAEARQLARGNRKLLAQIRVVEASATRAPVGGQIYRVRDIPARTIWSIDFNARGGEILNLAAFSNRPTDINMHVYDNSEVEVCRDVGHDASPTCSLTPRWTGAFRVNLVNLGRTRTRIGFITN